MSHLPLPNYCDHGHATGGETRFLPLGGGARLIVCKRHWAHELNYRREAHKAAGPEDLPEWETLEVESKADARF